MSTKIEMYGFNDIRPTYEYTSRFQEARRAKLARLAIRFQETPVYA